ncbi:Protein of unknown function [Chitinophaga sp. CF118]|uniref:DUF3829 domain-containing protein n=1 Tax=Chitinophaga sp. CF118 TaxID=1884367 RepID=UPI0008EF6F9D|nr:DUF3829 domain-containing protein [Chitinophaga sp. CF118]SFD02533.1 Protein of unknown function [Chitinophaga sp. CF118]
MKKIVRLFLLVALLVTAFSCKNNSGSYNDKSSESASNIIEYTNLIVDMSNNHNHYLEQVANNTDKIESALQKPEDRFSFIGITKPFLRPSHNFGKVKIDEPSDDLSKADQAFFKEKVTSYTTLFNSIKASNDELHDYLTAQDYKDDKGAKGFQLIDTIRSKMKTAYTLKSELMKKVETVADASEEVILKDSPLKDYIIAMKADMKSVREFIDLLEQGGDKYTSISDNAKSLYDALEAAQAKHAGINTDKAKGANKDTQFTSFYERLHSFLLDARKVLRNGSDKGELTESDISTLNNDYDSLINYYNSFNS